MSLDIHNNDTFICSENNYTLKKNDVNHNNFFKNVLFLSGGTFSTQVIGLLVAPLITRLYLPEQYGVLTVFISILGLFAGSECLRFELAIPIAENDEDAISLIALCLIVLASFSLIIFLVFLLSGNAIFGYLSATSIPHLRVLLPIGILLNGLYQILMRWNLRILAYGRISISKFVQSIVSNLLKLFFGVLHFSGLGLIVSQLFGENTAIIILGKTIFKKKYNPKKIFSIKEIKKLAIRYINFPLFSLPSTFISGISTQIPILFLSSMFSSSVAGLFSFSLGIVSIPVTLIGGSIGDVFFAEAASIGKGNVSEIQRLSKELFKKLFLVGLIPLLCLILSGPYLFELVFGSEWSMAGEYARILSFFAFSQLLFQPLSRVYDIFDKQKELLLITILRIILVVSSFLVTKLISLDPKQSIILYVVVMIFVHGITYFNAQRIMSNYLDN